MVLNGRLKLLDILRSSFTECRLGLTVSLFPFFRCRINLDAYMRKLLLSTCSDIHDAYWFSSTFAFRSRCRLRIGVLGATLSPIIAICRGWCIRQIVFDTKLALWYHGIGYCDVGVGDGAHAFSRAQATSLMQRAWHKRRCGSRSMTRITD